MRERKLGVYLMYPLRMCVDSLNTDNVISVAGAMAAVMQG